MPRPSHSRFYNPHNSGWGVQTIKRPIMKSSSLPCSPQNHILKHRQPTFLSQCQRPSFTPIQNNRQNYISI
jgi:hypothetical protein